jgi:hypothetical protein
VRLRVGIVPVVLGLTILATHGTPAKDVSAHLAKSSGAAGSSGVTGFVTGDYLAAARRYLLGIEGNMRSVDAALAKEERVVLGCPNVVANAPLNPSRARVEVGVVESLAIAIAHANMFIVSRLQNRVGRLHWSNPRVTDVVQRSLRAAKMEASLEEPPLCKSLRAWAHSRFLRTPRVLIKFNQRADLLSEAVKLLPSVLTKKEDQDNGRTVREIRSLQLAVGGKLRLRLVAARNKVRQVVGLQRQTTTAAHGRP